jgi:hypothetical protein
MAEEAANNFQVSATGGAGTAGQAAQYATGIDRAQDFYDLQTSAPMSKSGVEVPANIGSGAINAAMQDVVPLDAPTQRPYEPVTNGAVLGDGAGPEALASNSMLDIQNSQDLAKLAAYLPIYARIAESPEATNSTRNFYRWLRTQV